MPLGNILPSKCIYVPLSFYPKIWFQLFDLFVMPSFQKILGYVKCNQPSKYCFVKLLKDRPKDLNCRFLCIKMNMEGTLPWNYQWSLPCVCISPLYKRKSRFTYVLSFFSFLIYCCMMSYMYICTACTKHWKSSCPF